MGKIARLASLASVFAGLVGFLYLWGYWRRFGINFLEFATLTDLVRLSLVPVVTASLFAVAAYTLQIWFDADYAERLPPSPSTAPIPAAPRPAGKPWKIRLRRFGFWVFAGLVAASVAFTLWDLFYRDDPSNWYYLAVSAGLYVAFRLVAQGRVRVFELPARQSGVCVFLAIFLPILSYGSGAVRAKAIMTGGPSGYTDFTMSNGGSAIVGQARYLGTLGEFAFFWTRDETVRLAKWDQVLPLELSRRPKPEPDDEADDQHDEP